MPAIYPLRFQPIFRRYLWGGDRLGTVLQKPVGAGQSCAESWEIVDHGPDQSAVLHGSLAGKTLAEILREQRREMLGRHDSHTSFPLLLKFLDAQQALSVQVHPNDALAAQLTPPDLGKTEAWIVLAAEPRSLIYAGLKCGVDRKSLDGALQSGTCEDCLHSFEPRSGDCVFLPAGTVHALGAGLLIAEIQQSSDTTYRLHDWNRVGPDGKPRELHVQPALDAIDWDCGPVHPQRPRATDRPHVERLVACDKFVLDRWRLDMPQTIGGDDRFHIVAVLQGEVTLESDPGDSPLKLGQTALIPAGCGALRIEPQHEAVLLDAYLP